MLYGDGDGDVAGGAEPNPAGTVVFDLVGEQGDQVGSVLVAEPTRVERSQSAVESDVGAGGAHVANPPRPGRNMPTRATSVRSPANSAWATCSPCAVSR